MEMTMTKPSAAANATGLPASPICTFDWGKIEIPPFDAGDNFGEAWALYDALRLLSDVAVGLACQPRYYQDSKELRFNAAGRCLDALQESLSDAAAQIVRHADTAGSGTGLDQEYRAQIILDWKVRYNDGVDEVARVAARLAKEEAEGESA